jgi:hypothetical protein
VESLAEGARKKTKHVVDTVGQVFKSGCLFFFLVFSLPLTCTVRIQTALYEAFDYQIIGYPVYFF